MPGHGPVVGLGGPLADHDLRGDELLAAPAGACPRHAQRPSGAQASGQLAAQRAAALDVERLVDRLVRDPHRLIIGEVDPQPVGDLLRAPRRGPAAVLPAAVATTDPAHLRAGTGCPSGRSTARAAGPARTRAAVVGGELRDLRAPGAPIGVPLRGRGPVVQPAAPGRGVAAQLPRDRRRRAAQLAGRSHGPRPPGVQDRDLLPLRERQVATRRRARLIDGMPPPSRNHRAPPAATRRTPPRRPHSSTLERSPPRTRRSTSRHRRPSRRPHRAACTADRIATPLLLIATTHLRDRGVATTI